MAHLVTEADSYEVIALQSDGSRQTVYAGKSRFDAMLTARVYRMLLDERGWPAEVRAPGMPENISDEDCREAFLAENPWLR